MFCKAPACMKRVLNSGEDVMALKQDTVSVTYQLIYKTRSQQESSLSAK